MTKYAIIVAGGSGSRMGSKTPKQFLLLNGKPILMHTIEQFLAYDASLQVILVLPANQLKPWYALCEKHKFYPAVQTVTGGNTRFQSVKNGLKNVKANIGLVAVHDGVRPFVPIEVIANGFDIAMQKGTAVASVSLKDSLRQVDADGHSRAIDRTAYRSIQTPQIFRIELMQKAFQVEEQSFFTDCASVLEYAGFEVELIEGAYQNIKITTPEDLIWAETFLQNTLHK